MSKIVVATLYQLAMIDGKPSKDHKKLLRSNVKVQTSVVEATNDNWQDTCRLYEVDKEATAAYYERSEEVNEHRKRIKELKNAANADVLVGAVNAVVAAAADKKKPGPKPKE